MDPKRRSLSKSFSAKLADVRLFARMHPLVFFELLLPRKTFSADFARERLVAGVDSAMELEFLFGGQALAANVAED